jgi:two-component system sensor histidine kinase BaeS
VVRRAQNPVSLLGLRWLVISSVVTAAAGVLAAWLLARRLAQPLRRATAATHDLAAGQLHVRLPVDERAPPGDELAELSRSINALGASLQRSRGLEQRFLLSVSHDLRTPLTSIRGYADALADGTLTDVGKGAAIIQQESQRLERLVRDLLDLAHLDARSFRIELQPVELTGVARAIVEALSPDATRRGVTLRLGEPAEGSVAVVADPDRLGQVVANLVENALKFAISAVLVDTAVDADDPGRAVLRVTDDGPGVAPEDLPHLFERLYVSKRVPVRREVGSGLGLAIVRELVEVMGGQVAVTAAAPRGTCFAIRLPRSTVVR